MIALGAHARHAGSASALLGTVQFSLGSASGVAMGVFGAVSILGGAATLFTIQTHMHTRVALHTSSSQIRTDDSHNFGCFGVKCDEPRRPLGKRGARHSEGYGRRRPAEGSAVLYGSSSLDISSECTPYRHMVIESCDEGDMASLIEEG